MTRTMSTMLANINPAQMTPFADFVCQKYQYGSKGLQASSEGRTVDLPQKVTFAVT